MSDAGSSQGSTVAPAPAVERLSADVAAAKATRVAPTSDGETPVTETPLVEMETLKRAQQSAVSTTLSRHHRKGGCDSSSSNDW